MNVRSLPVTYRNNKTAWMTSDLFLEWLQTLDRKMHQQYRKILLFADNAPSHPDIHLENGELKFLIMVQQYTIYVCVTIIHRVIHGPPSWNVVVMYFKCPTYLL